MTSLLRVDRLELIFEPKPWAFALERRTAVEVAADEPAVIARAHAASSRSAPYRFDSLRIPRHER